MKIELLDEVDSTSEYIRRYLAAGEDIIVCARIQTGGRGTKGRSFLSTEGGVYCSALTFYQDVPAASAFRVMTHAAVSVCRTAEAFGVTPQIKWPNDVLACGRKLAGILIENSVSQGQLLWSIVGMGLNAENSLAGLEEVAVNLTEAAGRRVPMEAAREALIENYQKSDGMQDYLSYLRFLGKQVKILENGVERVGIARRVLDDGRLEIEEEGRLRALSAAEITLRI